ncbi:MAG: fumarate hydratase subunit beta [Peptostreptococcaceae bacterium]|jgi:fumarate hydratase subunit beta|nr:fumarate hydratase subunit beta [Peptostreptococcaceae bacterium]
MANKIYITTPLTDEIISNLKSGDEVLISGTIYTARDAAHKKLVDSINSGDSLPFDIKNAIIYYVGPSPKKPGDVIGSAGPTTSYRMDAYTPTLLDLGLKGMIGKGSRNKNVVESIKKNHAVYFAAIGGAGALISSTIKSSEIIAYEELGPEAVHKLTVEDFPAIVVLDSSGNDLYIIEREKYKK